MVTYDYSSARLTLGVSLYRSLTLEENIVAAITQGRVIDDILVIKVNQKPNFVFRLFLLNYIFQYSSNWSKVF